MNLIKISTRNLRGTDQHTIYISIRGYVYDTFREKMNGTDFFCFTSSTGVRRYDFGITLHSSAI